MLFSRQNINEVLNAHVTDKLHMVKAFLSITDKRIDVLPIKINESVRQSNLKCIIMVA